MKTLTRKELNKIIEEHKHWLNKDCVGWENMRANLSGANLCNADLSYTNLCNAYLSYTYLLNANLSGANLSGADFHGAILNNANLRGADLRGADLSGANLNKANLSGAKNVPYIPMVCPEEGDFIGWKKAEGNKNKVIVKLHIPSDAKRSSATTRKCRCSKAEVIAIYNLDGTEAGETTCHSAYDNSFIYEVGKTVEVADFSEDRWNECAKGIHFFINKQEVYTSPVLVAVDECMYETFRHCAEIGKQKRMTNKQLSRWLREKPTRECKQINDGLIYSSYNYVESCEDEEVDEGVMVREDNSEWREPLVEVEE